jgi:hypothetical protein
MRVLGRKRERSS